MTWTVILEGVDFDEVDLPDLKRGLTAVCGNYGSPAPTYTTVSTVQYDAHLDRAQLLRELREKRDGAQAVPRMRPSNRRRGITA